MHPTSANEVKRREQRGPQDAEFERWRDSLMVLIEVLLRTSQARCSCVNVVAPGVPWFALVVSRRIRCITRPM